MPNPIKTKAKIIDIKKYGNDIFKVLFLPEKKRATKFKPGQFLHLTLENYNPMDGYWPESRVFSISSIPNGVYLEIVYSIKGEYTKRMSEELKVEEEVWLKLPYGDFIIENYIEKDMKIALIAGGTGISPFIPFMLELESSNINIPYTLYYGIRNQDCFIYGEIIESQRNRANINVIEGMLNINSICSEITKNNDICFISGPLSMIGFFQKELLTMGFRSNLIIIDSWE